MSKLVYVIDVDVPESDYANVKRIHSAVHDLMNTIKLPSNASIHVNESADKVLKAAETK